MKLKTSDLNGAALDWAVANSTRKEMPSVPQWMLWDDYHPTRSWLHCGPLIEKYGVWLSETPVTYQASCETSHGRYVLQGETPLIAICRAVVASKLGDEVDIPDELMESQQ